MYWARILVEAETVNNSQDQVAESKLTVLAKKLLYRVCLLGDFWVAWVVSMGLRKMEQKRKNP